jgi:DNA-binding GntR family transcriptional regulator
MSRTHLERRSVPEAIADVIQGRVMSGDMAPANPLKEVQLASEFGASRNTVREALLILEGRGLLQRSPHRGTRVVEPTQAEIGQIMAAREVVEPGAVRRICAMAAQPRGEARLDRLLSIAERLEDAAAAGDWVNYGALDLAFHVGLVRAGGGATLAAAFEALVRPLYVHLLAADRSGSGDLRHVSQHRGLVELLAAGTGLEALALIEGHLADARSVLARSAEALPT